MAVKPTFATPGDALSIQTHGSQKLAVGYSLEADTSLGVVYGPKLEFTGTKPAAAGSNNITLEDVHWRLEDA
jgi:hypothetical protein